MDDYFQIIIYLIIIFAFLNSLFKKKDKGEAPKRTAGSSPQQQRKTYSSGETEQKRQNEYDILKEIEGLFKGEKTYPSADRKAESDIEIAEMRKVPASEHTEDKEWHTEDEEWHSENKEWHTENKEWHTESDEWHEKSTTEHELDKSWHSITQYKRTNPVDAVIEKEAEKFERMLAERNKVVPYPFNELRKILYSPKTLQDYIVVSEIIGKPKYLRR
jgi:hypothetical protein